MVLPLVAIAMDQVNTIADSLGAPETLDFGLNIVRQQVDEVITVSDAELAHDAAYAGKFIADGGTCLCGISGRGMWAIA